jgi:hypothetical protein
MNEPWRIDSDLGLIRNILLQHGFQSDGVVLRESAILPYAEYVELDNVDHLATVMRTLHGRFDRARMNRAILKLLLTR